MKRILIVEDALDWAALFRAACEAHGYTVEVAHNLAGATELLTTALFDCVLLDLGLPDSDGMETLEKTVAPGRPPILVMTDNDDRLFALQCCERGAEDYLVKNTVDSNTEILGWILAKTIARQDGRKYRR